MGDETENEYDFEGDVLASEVLCDRCQNVGVCPFTGEDDSLACETYKALERIL